PCRLGCHTPAAPPGCDTRFFLLASGDAAAPTRGHSPYLAAPPALPPAMPDSSSDRTRTESALAEHLLTRLPPGEAYGRADLARLPVPVAHYLGGVLDRRLAREAALPESDWFDGRAEAVREAARAWHTAVRAAARVPAEAWETTVRTAARQLLAYLVTPVETLADWVFADGPAAPPVERVRARMAAFPPYPYLREIAESYLDRKGVTTLERPEFERLLRRIDRRMVGDYGTADWMVLLEPLFELVGALPGREGAVPTPLLQRFFEARALGDLARDLAGPDAYAAATLRVRLATLLPDLDDSSLPVDPSDVEEELAEADDEPRGAADLGTEEGPERDEPEPLWQRLARQRAAEPEPPLPAPEPEPEPMPAREPEGESEPLWKRFAGPEARDDESDDESGDAPTRRETLAQLETRVLGPHATERRDWYKQHLTGGDEARYAALLRELDAARDWSAAIRVLGAHYKREHVPIYSDAAVAFTDDVEARFRP